MSIIKAMVAFALVATLAACAQQEEPAPEPIIIEEPTSDKF